jgi:murein DD-endopeptidase MepM/ murein hydrolase activator NlpD
MANSRKFSRFVYLIVGVVICFTIAASLWLVFEGFEEETPTLQWETVLETVGRTITIEGTASDQKRGLRRIWIALMQEGREAVLLDETFPSVGLLREGVIRKHTVSIDIDVPTLGFTDGEAMLRTAVWDYSYCDWFTGNRSYAEYQVLIDTKPPRVEMVTQIHNVNQGGSGLAIYKVSEAVASTGVRVDDEFYPGLKGYFSDGAVFVALFALPHNKGSETHLQVTATDKAGNVGRAGFAYHINTKRFRKDTIPITDGFLRRKIPEFEGTVDTGSSQQLFDAFLRVNREVRRDNYETIRNICAESDAVQHWDGAFLRLPASARKAGFADHRTYRYNGKAVDRQFHLGIDLASTSHAPVPAANGGRIVFADDLGIYGRTVVIDHGFYLFSMYSHLNSIKAAKGQMVAKGDIIGFTGTTGLAGGDHLHFSMLVHHTFVNPIEWWDGTWIRHNISDKLQGAVERAGAKKKEASL